MRRREFLKWCGGVVWATTMGVPDLGKLHDTVIDDHHEFLIIDEASVIPDEFADRVIVMSSTQSMLNRMLDRMREASPTHPMFESWSNR